MNKQCLRLLLLCIIAFVLCVIVYSGVDMFYAVEYVHSDKNFVDSDGCREVYLYRFNSAKYRDYFVNEFPHIRDSISNTKAPFKGT